MYQFATDLENTTQLILSLEKSIKKMSFEH